MIIKYITILIASLLLILVTASRISAQITTSSDSLMMDTFPEHWINGEDCTTEPNGQVHRLNKDLYIIRQLACTNFEALFIYRLLGQNKVLMQDSGTSDFGQRQLVDDIIEE